MRVLFLDFDGVLHPYGFQVSGSVHPSGKPRAYVEKVEHFCWVPLLANLLLDHPDVVVIVHSTWRYNHSLQELQSRLGPVLGPRVRGVVPNGQRLDAIHWWLSQNKQVRSYRILDDDAKSFPEPFPAELIFCPDNEGISTENVQQQLREWLALES